MQKLPPLRKAPIISRVSLIFELKKHIFFSLNFYFSCFLVKSDIFNESSDDDKGNNNNQTAVPIPHSTNIDSHPGLRDELPYSIQRANNPTADTIFRQPHQPASRVVAANLFDSEPPELDEDASPILPSTQNAARKSVNLFLDDDDDDEDFDMFAPKKTESAPAIGKAPQIEPKARKPINLFEDEDEIDEALFASSAILENKPESSIANTATKKSILSPMPTKNSLLKNLFDDEPPEDDFDFLTKPAAVVVGRQKEVVTATSVSVKPNETEKEAEKEEKDSISTVPLSKFVKEKVPAEQLLSKINLFDDDDEDSFERLIGSKVETVNRNESTLAKLSVVVQPEAVDDDDDGFEKLIGSKAVDKEKSMSAFDDQIFVQPKAIDSLEKPPRLSKQIFDDDSDNDDPFIDAPALNASEASVQDSNDDLFETIAPKKAEKPTFNYASPHLFDDLPPEDDDDFVTTPAPSATKQPGEFYNDFSETVTVSTAEASISQYSYLFNDEPPPDDDLFQAAKPNISAMKHSDSEFSRKLHLFANPEKAVDEPAEAAIVTNKPRKLNIGNFDINVAALLPGAKRTVSNIKSDAVSPSDRIEDETESVTSSTIAKSVDIENVDGAGRLKNLNRNRAKVQMRRASTRRGRLQQYQRALDAADETIPDSIEEVGKEVAPDNGNPHITAMTAKEAVPLEPEPSAIPNKIEEKVQPVAVTAKIELPNEPAISNKKPEVVIPGSDEQPPAIKSTDLSFLDDSDGETLEDDDWLSNVIGPTAKTATKSKSPQNIASKSKIETSLFDADSRTEVKADLPVAQIKSGANASSNLTLPSDIPPPVRQSNSLFKDLEDPEDDDDIFSPVPSHSVQKPPLKSSSLFKDIDESGGEKPPPLQQSDSLFDNLDEPEDDDDIFSPVPAHSVTKKQTAPKSHSLFDDDDENHDDLPLPEAIKSTIAPVAVLPTMSLFGDDVSDDDDLFGAPKSAKKQTKRVATTSNMATVLNSKKIPSGKLFSDSDDEDDDTLFGSKAKPPSVAATKAVASSAVQNRITKAKVSSVTDQDPLADLFK